MTSPPRTPPATPPWLTWVLGTAFVLCAVGLLFQLVGGTTVARAAVTLVQLVLLGVLWWLARTGRWARRR